jgi:CoA:oxalate CoA-transferase
MDKIRYWSSNDRAVAAASLSKPTRISARVITEIAVTSGFRVVRKRAAGEPGDPPGQILPGIGDEIEGLRCAWGVTAALFAREKTGKGQVVDTSLMSGLIGALAFVLAAPAIMDQEFPRQVQARAGNPLYNQNRCRDDRWLAIAHLDPDCNRPKICAAQGLEEFRKDPRCGTIPGRGKNAAELVALLDQRFACRDRAEWMEILKQEG